MKKGFKKMNLQVDCEDQDNLTSSVYSEIGPDGLRFLKYDIKVSKHGLSQESNQHRHVIQLEDIDISGIRLGGGAAGQVYEGVYKPLGVKVAVKKINIYDKEKRYQLMNDIRILLQNKIKQEQSNTNCLFFVNLYGAFYDQGNVKVILELMDVGSLNDLILILKASKQKNNPLIPEQILAKIIAQILQALMYLHVVGNQVHRDIKPGNILINSKGEVKLTDFGIMKELEATHQLCQTFLGTKAYMSPERFEGLNYNNKSDIWSLGLIIIEMATGEYPYPLNIPFIQLREHVVLEESPKLPQNDSFSNELIDFTDLCLQKNHRQRASATQLMSHPWILNNLDSDYEISEWLVEIKKNLDKI